VFSAPTFTQSSYVLYHFISTSRLVKDPPSVINIYKYRRSLLYYSLQQPSQNSDVPLHLTTKQNTTCQTLYFQLPAVPLDYGTQTQPSWIFPPTHDKCIQVSSPNLVLQKPSRATLPLSGKAPDSYTLPLPTTNSSALPSLSSSLTSSCQGDPS
jgi:hypothetical protein